MKDLVITGRQVRRELWILLGCFVAGCLVNVYAIVHYGRPAGVRFIFNHGANQFKCCYNNLYIVTFRLAG